MVNIFRYFFSHVKEAFSNTKYDKAQRAKEKKNENAKKFSNKGFDEASRLDPDTNTQPSAIHGKEDY